jgi:hypothetical protein
MVKLIDEIQLAWNSIQATNRTSGWNTVAVLNSHPGRFLAGRNFPNQCEALLVSFRTNAIKRREILPEGLGFQVARLDSEQDGLTWLALTRNPNGNLELFTSMVSNVLDLILSTEIENDDIALRVFLGRIKAWQEFMKKDSMPLSAENEVGLVGELTLLEQIIYSGMLPDKVIGAWTGPNDGLRDFELGFGAIEVKSTISNTGFIAKIGSLDQLDDTKCKPIYLGAIRFSLTDNGQTLAEKISAIRALLKHDPITLTEFENRLLAAGYIAAHDDNYHRKFSCQEISIIEIDENFPRITYGQVNLGIISARYEINIEPLFKLDIGLTAALKKLEMI